MTIDRYRIIEEIARNGPITVYRAHHEILKRITLLKVYDGADQELIARFEEEARIVAALESDFVTRIYDFGFANDHLFFIAAEYVEGGNLTRYLSRRQPDMEQRIRLCARIAQAVCYIHDKGYIHRDLKPENILVTGEGEIKLTDFGISLHEAIKRHTPDQKLVGTPLYMAPEQVNNLPVSRQTDIFALGTIFYTLFTDHPFDAPSYGEIFAKIISHRQPPLAETDARIPEWFSELVQQMLQKKASKRPEDLHSVLQTFRRYTDMPNNSGDVEDERRRMHPLAGLLILLVPLLLYVMFSMVRERQQREPVQPLSPADSGLSRQQDTTVQPDSLPRPVKAQPSRPAQQTDNDGSPAGLTVNKEPARLWVNAFPWARVYIDYDFIDVTPLKDTLQLKPGWHKLQLQNPAYATWTDSVFLKAGEFRELGYHLDSLCYTMRIQVQPWGKVYIDGVYIGDTPLNKPLLLTKANKSLTIKNRYFKTYTEKLEWDGSPVVERKIILEKKAGIQ